MTHFVETHKKQNKNRLQTEIICFLLLELLLNILLSLNEQLVFKAIKLYELEVKQCLIESLMAFDVVFRRYFSRGIETQTQIFNYNASAM